MTFTSFNLRLYFSSAVKAKLIIPARSNKPKPGVAMELLTCLREQLTSMGWKSVWTQNPRVETLRPPVLPGRRNWDGARGGELGMDEVRADASTAVDETFDSK